jgi:hypothetical protein
MTGCRSFTYAVYGQTFSSDLAFQCRVHPAAGPVERCLRWVEHPVWGDARWKNAQGISPADVSAEIEIRRDRQEWAMRFPGTADFWFGADEFQALVFDRGDKILAEIHFLDCVLPFWLELNDVPFLHASAVEWDGRAIAFSAFAGGGKSSLTTALTLRGGGFVTDDVLVLRQTESGCLAYPGYPQIRLWGDAAEQLLPPEAHEQIHARWPKRRGIVERFGRSMREPVPLAAIYLLENSAATAAEIQPLGGREGFFKLLDNLPALAALDYPTQARRTAFLAEILREVPVRRLRYPKNYEALDAVLDAVLEDVRGLP